MSKYFVAHAIAKALYQSEGFISITIPAGVESPQEMTRQIVDRLNELVPSAVPYALEIIDDNTDIDDESLEKLQDEQSSLKTTSQAIKYRTAPKRAIVASDQSALLSISGVFVPAVEWSFPATVSNSYLNMQNLAYAAIDVCVEELGLSPEGVDDRCRERMHAVFNILKGAYESHGSTASTWNGLLLRHFEVGLKELVDRLQRINRESSLEEAVFANTFPAFSLPNPKRGNSYGNGNSVDRAVDKYWGSSELISKSIASLNRKTDALGECELGRVDWQGFDDTISTGAKGSALLALALHEVGTGLKCEAFSTLSEEDFFTPATTPAIDPLIADNDGNSLNIPEISSNLFFVALNREDDGDLYSSELVQVVFPLSGTVSKEEVLESNSSLVVSSRNVRFLSEGTSFSEIPEGIAIAGKFVVETYGEEAPTDWTIQISITCDSDDTLFGVLPTSTQIKVTLLNAEWDCLGFGKAGGRLEWVGVQYANHAPIDDLTIPFDSGGSYSLVTFSCHNADAIRLNESPLGSVPHRKSILYKKLFRPRESDVLGFATSQVRFREMSDLISSALTPLGAAVRNEVYRFAPITGNVARTLRAQAEHFYSQNLRSSHLQDSLGHILLSSEIQDSFNSIDPSPEGTFLVGREFSKLWSTAGLYDIPDSFSRSREVDHFKQTFHTLLDEVFANPLNDGLRDQAWPSQLVYAGVAGSQSLASYLEAFTEMVEFSKTFEDPLVHFWAAYPFSLSVWESAAAVSLQAVLLSPLHPIRLGWLAGVEAALTNAQSAQSLAGSVEGWNFPFFGPSDSLPGRLIAVPADSDHQQVFTAWSVLVGSSIAGHKPLTVPERAGGIPMPGVSTTGLNSNAVRNAITSFRRTRPYLSTLTFDLAATSSAPKIAEIDSTVLSQAIEFLSDRAKNGLAGGVRVYDSLKREGAIPEIRVESIPSVGVAPITWRRYDDGRESVKANVRILQDSGVSVQVQQNSPERFGAVGKIPFRRFEVPQKFIAGPAASAHYSPTFQLDQVEPFARAVVALETTSGQATTAKIKILPNSPLLGTADWIISGESMVSPSALSEILRSGPGANSMLWEWNPPIFNRASKVNETPIDQRPYFSIATIPEVFKSNLRSKLKVLHGREVGDEEITDLLTLLGSRGIGLSSLISAGGSQYVGALGFYTVLRLMEALKGDAQHIFVIPIDVSANFLSSLATDRETSGSEQRADLLIIQVLESTVVLSPVEIKFYSIDNPIVALPAVGSFALEDPKRQLESTVKILKEIVDALNNSTSQSSEADKSLMWNAFATMVEAGMRLDPEGDGARRGLVPVLQELIDGKALVKVGKPIVAYFARTQHGSPALYSSLENASRTTFEFIADPTVLFAEFDNSSESSPTLDIWRKIVTESLLGGLNDIVSAADVPTSPSDAADTPVGELVSPSPRGMTHASNPELAENPPANEDVISVEVAATVEEAIEIPEVEVVDETLTNDGARFVVGQLFESASSADVDFWPGNTELNQLNIGVVGDLGTGKTQLLQSMIYQLRVTAERVQDNSISILIFDYKSDYQGEAFKNAAGVTVLDPESIPLNIFHVDGEKTQRKVFQKAKSFVDVIAKIYSNVGPKQKSALTKIIIELMIDNDVVTFDDVCREYVAQPGGPDAVSAILENFSLGGVFSTKREELKPLRELLDNRVLVVNLSALGADQETKNALVALMLNQYFDYMITLTKWPFGSGPVKTRRLNNFLLVDEATNIMQFGFPVLEQILLQGREYGVGVMLSSQYLSHFDDGGTNYAEPLRTWFIHRVPNVTVKELSKIGNVTPNETTVAKIQNLQPHQAFYVSYGWNGRFIRGRAFYELIADLD